ncbi:hypothetical protein GCM10009037_30440 [Halarchaeum grantii]|uniref:DUF58 domain-containing protein n=1 Tax=Halarchaeum grantii TaxID=1193105 RepID=A0A830EZA7_9EURY|nr:DUF58 domain-containing protein [Halarchaeum grantii]GGL44955.1 hypothetical protein GCM10009037_30440 [Halarchaeum grantii]
MRVTRTGREALLLLALLAGFAVVFARPLVLLGLCLLGGWVLAAQLAFVRTLRTLTSDLSVSIVPAQETLMTDESVPVVLTATREETDVPLEIAVTPPAAADVEADAASLSLADAEHAARTVFSLTVPVAGRHTVSRPTVTVRGAFGLFSETLPIGEAVALTVEPRLPRDVQVGAGDVRMTTPYGSHTAERWGAGVDPADIREYQPGDPATRIDWLTTARLNEPFLREAEATTERQTAVFVDHRATTGVGRSGVTAFDYLREAALAVVESAAAAEDPLSYYAVGDDGVTDRVASATAHTQYPIIERKLHALTPTTGDGVAWPKTERGGAGALTRALRGDDSTYASTLRPYVTTATRHQHATADDPLYRAAKTFTTRHGGQHWHVVFTDDAHRAELQRTVNLLQHGDDHVLVFIAPRALYEPDALADLESAYAAYSEFVAFRESLAKTARVEAYEVTPGERLEALLTARRERRRPA